VPDLKPPRLDAGERETLQTSLQYQRDSLVRKVTRIDDEAARRTVLPSGTSLLWLVKHVRTAETLWMARRFAGEDIELPDDTVHPEDSLHTAVAAYRATCQHTDAIVAATPSLDERCRGLDDGTAANLRWVLTHLVEETARHAGHADIIRELLDGSVGR
jgi:uncharacterized damage-inducible protein DinB